jgi:hypothetical protein
MPKGILQHWGTTRSEEGWSIDDGELRRVELTEGGWSGGDDLGFITDGSAAMVGLGREANEDAGGVAYSRFDMEKREREKERAEKELTAWAPF